jgi:hypothetical protein
VGVLCSEGIANHTGPESCVVHREMQGEALRGESVGQPESRESLNQFRCRRRIEDPQGVRHRQPRVSHPEDWSETVRQLTDAQFANFIAGIRTGEKLISPISVANASVTMLQLSNIAWSVNRELKLDTKSRHVFNDPAAMQMWSRTYEKGWEVRV